MTRKTQKKAKEGSKVLPKDVIICKHCREFMFHPRIIGLSLVCTACEKPQNGRLKLDLADFQ